MHDRIDYIYYHNNLAGKAIPLQADTIDTIPRKENGEEVYWPSDHRAVWVRMGYFD